MNALRRLAGAVLILPACILHVLWNGIWALLLIPVWIAAGEDFADHIFGRLYVVSERAVYLVVHLLRA